MKANLTIPSGGQVVNQEKWNVQPVGSENKVSLKKQMVDLLDKYLLGEVAYLAYVRAMQALSEDTERVLGIERYVQLCPGSVYDWSVSDVKDIFALMDGLYQKLNVRVLDSGMIEPIKSVSGIFYATEEEFASCAICPRANCDNRVMEYDEELHHQLVND